MLTSRLPPELAAALEDLVETCRRLLQEGARLPPTLAVVTPGRVFLVAMQAPRAMLHERLRRLGQAFAHLHPLAVALVAGTYYRDLSSGSTPPAGSLADDPEAREALTIAIADRGGNLALRVLPYRRQGKEGGLLWEEEMALPKGATFEAPILAAFWQGVLEAPN